MLSCFLSCYVCIFVLHTHLTTSAGRYCAQPLRPVPLGEGGCSSKSRATSSWTAAQLRLLLPPGTMRQPLHISITLRIFCFAFYLSGEVEVATPPALELRLRIDGWPPAWFTRATPPHRRPLVTPLADYTFCSFLYIFGFGARGRSGSLQFNGHMKTDVFPADP